MGNNSYRNISDMLKSMKDNPKELFKEGQEVSCKCPICNQKTVIKITSKGKGICKECNTEMDIEFNVK